MSGIKQMIDSMSMEEFYTKCIIGVLRTDEVSKLMTSNVGFLSSSEVTKIKESLWDAGFISEVNNVADNDIEEIIRYMSKRAFARR